jgi:hypothetical protein
MRSTTLGHRPPRDEFLLSETLVRIGQPRGITLRSSLTSTTAQGEAELGGELREVQNGQKGCRAADLRDGRGELLVGLAGISTLASLGQTKGRVRSVWACGAHGGEGRWRR